MKNTSDGNKGRYAKVSLARKPLHNSRNCHCEGVEDDRSNLISLITFGRDRFAELAMTRFGSYAKLSLIRGMAEGRGVRKPPFAIAHRPLVRGPRNVG